jgi:hypothetical protein
MRKRGNFIYRSAVGTALGALLAPRCGESRRVALARLRLSLRPGRGSLNAFGGTPCSQAGPNSAEAEKGPTLS